MKTDDGDTASEDSTRAERDTPDTRRIAGAVLVGLILVAFGTGLASWVATDGGEISIEDTTFETESGLELVATVYEPPGASGDEPAPAVVLIHGHGGERGTMSSFGHELAKRGYVAVAVDQPGHRDSAPPAYEDGWGGPAALEYTRSLDTTDENRVSLAGHSMGGFASLAAAKEYPDGYESVTLIGSTWGDSQSDELPAANTTFPRNMAVVFSPFDEYGPLMFGESVPGNAHESEKLMSAFGTEEPVEAGEVYGSVEEGTARRFTTPRTIHTGMHRSRATVADTVEWVALTTGPDGGEAEDDEDSQSWHWATLGHVLAFVGALVVAVGVAGIAWRRSETLAERETDERGSGDGGSDGGSSSDNDSDDSDGDDTSRWRLLALTAFPAVTLYPLYMLGTVAVPVTRLTHQELTHGYVVWSLGAVAVGVGFVAWRSRGEGKGSSILERLPDRTVALRTVGAAVAGFVAVYLVVFLASTFPGSGFRAWMVGLAPLPNIRWVSVAVYVVPLTVGTVALSFALEGTLRGKDSRGNRVLRHTGSALAVACGGLAASLAVQYVPLFLGFGMPVPALGPVAITGIWGIFLLGTATVLAASTTRLTRNPMVGGVLAGLVVTWVVAGVGPMTVAPF